METNIGQEFQEFYYNLLEMVPRMIVAFVVLIIFIIAGKIFYRTIGRRIQKKGSDKVVSSFISEIVKWGIYIMGVITALHIVGFGSIASSIITSAGIGAIIFGFAFKDIGENFLSGILLAVKRNFEINDIIEVDNYKGTVKDIDLRTTHIRNVEGKDIYIPNSVMLKNTVVNYTKDGFLRLGFMIGIAPESPIDDVRTLILDFLKTENYVLTKPGPKVLVKELGEFTTDVEVQFWIDVFDKDFPWGNDTDNTVRSYVIADIKKLLDANGIEMPSQVLEHKMYRNGTINVKSAEEEKGA